MQLIRWQTPNSVNWPTFSRVTDFSDEIDRLFDLSLTGEENASACCSGWTPALDVYEDKEQFVVKAELPGMKREDINVSLEDGSLTVSGERKNEPKTKDSGVHQSELYFGQFHRSVDLPTVVVADQVKAEYRDGILIISLPKAEEAKPNQINISVK